jgi:hypothetical protein
MCIFEDVGRQSMDPYLDPVHDGWSYPVDVSPYRWWTYSLIVALLAATGLLIFLLPLALFGLAFSVVPICKFRVGGLLWRIRILLGVDSVAIFAQHPGRLLPRTELSIKSIHYGCLWMNQTEIQLRHAFLAFSQNTQLH